MHPRALRLAAPPLLTLGALGALGLAAAQEPLAQAAPQVDAARKRVLIPARLELAAFAASDPPGHHLLAWSGGGAGKKALLATPVPDEKVLDALLGLGAKAGDNLSAAAWEARDDPADPAPDARAEGSTLRLLVRVPGGQERPASDLLEDLDGRGYEWRLAGNRALIARWRSGCVACLQSCPGAKVANRQATMRDLHRGRARFQASAWARELGEGAALEVVLELVPADGSNR